MSPTFQESKRYPVKLSPSRPVLTLLTKGYQPAHWVGHLYRNSFYNRSHRDSDRYAYMLSDCINVHLRQVFLENPMTNGRPFFGVL